MTIESLGDNILHIIHNMPYKDREDLFDLECHFVSEAMAYRILYFKPELIHDALIQLGYFLDDHSIDSIRPIHIHCRNIQRILSNKNLHRTEIKSQLIFTSIKLSVIKTLLYLSSLDKERTFNKLWDDEELLQTFNLKKIDNIEYDIDEDFFKFIKDLNISSYDLSDEEISSLEPDDLDDESLFDFLELLIDAGDENQLLDSEIEYDQQESFSIENKVYEAPDYRDEKSNSELGDEIDYFIENFIIRSIRRAARSQKINGFPFVERGNQMKSINLHNILEEPETDFQELVNRLKDLNVDEVKINVDVDEDKVITFSWNESEYREFFNSLDYIID